MVAVAVAVGLAVGDAIGKAVGEAVGVSVAEVIQPEDAAMQINNTAKQCLCMKRKDYRPRFSFLTSSQDGQLS